MYETNDILKTHGYISPQLIGTGAFSSVYRVKGVQDGKFYACKVSEKTEMLAREAGILKELSHPLFPVCYEMWTEGETGFLIMEYVAGRSLGRLLDSRGRLSARRAAEIGLELAEGLSYLHERRRPVFYRDLKPENIYIREDGRVKLLDFGCACKEDEKAGERVKVLVGTPGFAAPEQLSGSADASAAGDIYGLGKVLQSMLSARDELGRMLTRESFLGNSPESRLRLLALECTRENPGRRPACMRLCIYRILDVLEKIKQPYSLKELLRSIITFFYGSKALPQKNIIVEKYIWKK